MVKFILSNSDSPRQQIEEALNLISKINQEVAETGRLMADLSDLEWMLPCSAILIGQKMFELTENSIEINISPPKNTSLKNYLAAIGFPLGKKGTGERHIPIHHFRKNDSDLQENVIESEMEDVMQCVKLNLPENMHQAIRYLLSELSDNIDQHSKFTQGSIMVQYYPSKGHMDIGVFDNGLSIPKVYELSGIKIENDCDALEKAVRGVSTKIHEGGRGYGLSSSKEIVLEGLNGNFNIISRRAMLSLNKSGKTEISNLNLPFYGTLVYMRFEVPKKGLNIYSYLG